jgi:hypothetical protein
MKYDPIPRALGFVDRAVAQVIDVHELLCVRSAEPDRTATRVVLIALRQRISHALWWAERNGAKYRLLSYGAVFDLSGRHQSASA